MRGENSAAFKQPDAASLLPARMDLRALRAPRSRFRKGEIEIIEDLAEAALVTVTCRAASVARDCHSLVDRPPQLRQDLKNR
jgi:hypothetical protein